MHTAYCTGDLSWYPRNININTHCSSKIVISTLSGGVNNRTSAVKINYLVNTRPHPKEGKELLTIALNIEKECRW